MADCEACSLMVATAPPVPVASGVFAEAGTAARTMDRVSPQASALAFMDANLGKGCAYCAYILKVTG